MSVAFITKIKSYLKCIKLLDAAAFAADSFATVVSYEGPSLHTQRASIDFNRSSAWE